MDYQKFHNFAKDEQKANLSVYFIAPGTAHYESHHPGCYTTHPKKKTITCERKSQVDQHVKTAKHLAGCKLSKTTKTSQISLQQAWQGSSKTSEQDTFNSELCDALISANIPLNKVQHPKFKRFLENVSKRIVPHESTLRKNYVAPLYENVLTSIRSHIENNYLYIIVDETTDSCGRYIVNLLIGVLNENIPPTSFLISTRQLVKTNAVEIVRFVNEELMKFFAPNIVPTEKILLFLSDAAAYMIKASSNMKVLYKNIIHVTCLAHGINRVAEEIRSEFPLLNSLIKNVKKVFLKAPLRIQLYKERLPNIPLPPEPVITRWGTWLEAALFYAEHFESIKEVIFEFGDVSEALTQCKNIFQREEVKWQLAFVKSHFSCLSSFIKELETQKMPLCTAIEVVNRCESLLIDAASVGSSISANKILNKFKSVIGRNDGFKLLRDISLILSGQSNGTQIRTDLNPDMIASLKFAPITSVDVERSFSAYKDILSDRRQRFTVDNLEKHLIIRWYSTVVDSNEEY